MAKRILTAVVFVPLLLVVLVGLPLWCTGVLVAGIAALASYELLRATARRELPGILMCAVPLTAGIIPLLHLTQYGTFASYLLAFLLMLVCFAAAIARYDSGNEVGFDGILKCLFAGVLIPVFLSSLVSLRALTYGNLLVLLPFAVAFITDGGAYFVGVFLGKHRGITRVSPNKSLEGYIGGIFFGVLAAVLYGFVLERAMGIQCDLLCLSLYGLLGGVVTELGDLSFSLIKREFGVKDYGKLLPGHGGMLDRFDSMIFAAPMIYLLFQLFPAF